MEGIDLDGPEPIYQQIAAVLRARIAAGTYPPRRRIPSTAALSAEFGVSTKTARAAVELLEREGAVFGVKGRGVFVAEQE